MKLTRNMLTEMAFEIIEEHNGVRLKRPAVMLESKRVAAHLSHKQRKLVKEALKNHMIKEGLLDSIKDAFGGAKKAMKSFVGSFQKAPKNWSAIKSLVNQHTLNFTNQNWSGTPVGDKAEKLGIDAHEWLPQYARIVWMIKSCTFKNKSDLTKDFAKWIKGIASERDAANDSLSNGKIRWSKVINQFRKLISDKRNGNLKKGFDKSDLKGKELGVYGAFMEQYFNYAKELETAERLLSAELMGNPNPKKVKKYVSKLRSVMNTLDGYAQGAL